MHNVKYLFFHTAAADIPNVDAKKIDEWHKHKGWKGIGYHYVIIDDRHDDLADGTLQVGRPETSVGAHVLGVNDESIGICCVGHGDVRDYTQKQKATLVQLLVKLSKKYKVPVSNILGHREVNDLIKAGKVSAQFKTTKTCPGKKVDTNQIRKLVSQSLTAHVADSDLDETVSLALNDPSNAADSVKNALAILANNEHMFGNAVTEWKSFYYNGEIQGIVEA